MPCCFSLPCCHPLDRIASRRSLGRLGIIRGYAGPWLAEIYYLGDQRVLEVAIARRAIKSDQLSPREIPLQIEPHLVIIQARVWTSTSWVIASTAGKLRPF